MVLRIVISHNHAKIKVDSCDPLPLEKTLTFHNAIHSKSVLNKDQNHYYYILHRKIQSRIS